MSEKEKDSKQDEKQYDYRADFRCNTMLMLEIFTKIKIDPVMGVKPSVYVRELYMSNEERQHFLNVNNDCIQLFPNSPSKQVLEKWDVKPRIIFFSKWTIGEEYETFFTVRNRYRTSKLLKLSLKDSPVFELEKLVNFNRLGSMVTFGYKVRFRPKEFIDYHDTIKLEAENGNFEIYVLAISPRPMIDFPDEIDFGDVLFNFYNSKQVRLQNISPIVVEASLETHGIFSLGHHKILLNPNETMNLKINLNEKKEDTVEDKLLVTFQTGERLYVNLSAKCYSANIYFDQNQEINMGEMFVGLRSAEVIHLVNESDELLSYAWMNNRNSKIDDLESHVNGFMLSNKLKLMKEKTDGLKYYKMIDDKTHKKISYGFIDEELDTKLTFYFNDKNFDIQPLEGHINPKSKQRFVVIFKPISVNKIQKKAYLEIEGYKERLKLKLIGVGIGPQIVLNVNTIDFDQIFICSQHTYIISAKNIGLVKGTITYLADTLLSFGETINCSPLSLELLPGEVKIFEMSLSSTVAGSFIEDIWFVIEESQTRVRCIVKGCIINPKLILNKKIINFGSISLGFKYTSSFTITNESPIPVEYKIEVLGDGFLPASQIDSDFETLLPLYPQEFQIDPVSNQILPSFSQTVEISLVSNIIRDYTTILKIYLWEVLVEECSLTLKYTSVTPIITCKPSKIFMRYAFIDYDYTQQITLINTHNLPTYYAIMHQDETSLHHSPGLLYNLDEYTGYLGPNSTKDIQVYIRVLSLQPTSESLHLRVFGLSTTFKFCQIQVYGMGPVVNPSTFMMSWGSIPVLKNIKKSLYLINVSPICAFYKVLVEKYPFIWNVSCPEGSVPADSEFEIIITATLRDSGIIEDQLIIEVIGSRDITVSLSAQGFGTSIMTVPNLFPVYDIGKVFRKEKHNDTIKVTNAGTRHHTIVFTTMKEIKNLTKAKADQEQGNYFKLIPYKLDLEGGETQDMRLLYEWDKIEVLEDTYYCYAIIERRGKRVFLGSSTIKASFTDTELTFEPTSLHFRVDVPEWSSPMLPQYKALTVSSQWSHTLFLHCQVKKPFAFKGSKINKGTVTSKSEDILKIKLEPEESQTLEVKFDPSYISNRYSRVCYAELIVKFKDHKVQACVPLRGEVNFPNIKLSTHEINFGCVQPYTDSTQYAVLSNNTPLAIEYEWLWSHQRLSELKSHSAAEATNFIPDADDEAKLSEERSYFSYNEEEFYEGGEEGEEIDESKLKQIVDNIQKNVSAQIIINQSLPKSLSDFSTDVYSSESLIEGNIKTSPKNTDEVDSTTNNFLSNEKTPDQNVYCVDNESTPIMHKTKQDDKSLLENINKFGINEILRKIPSSAHKSIVSQVIDIIPPKGELKPHDTQQVTFVFNPSQLMKIVGKALLIVSGGPQETVTFKGSCYHALYDLIPPQINFGFGPFCELWCSSLFICNKGLKDIQVVVNIPDFNPSAEQTESIFLMSEKKGTSPKITCIPSCDVAAYRIALYPGRVGEIIKKFTIQIDDLPPVSVILKGYALPHQVHIALPRTIEPFLYENMYIVIASLTSQWFSLNEDAIDNFDSVKLTADNIQLSEVTEGWEMVPEQAVAHISTDDINMAYERYGCELISIQYNGAITHTTNILGMNYLVGFDMPPYHLNFGSVIINTKAQCMVVYSNYCPIESIIKINFPENSDDLLEKYGVVLKPLCSHVLQPFESKQFAILLKPPHNAIPSDEIEENISFSFYFKVSCGPTIPVNVSASITKPYLCTPDSFDFGYVKIGYKRYMKCFISNINTVGCEWFAFIRPLRTYRFCDPVFREKVCPFTVQPVYGYAEPKSKFCISIGFEPVDDALYDVVLQFIINMNPQSVAIRLKGCGLKPHLTVDKISFGYSIPYAMPVRERLTIRNPCLFPVQAYVIGTPKDLPREQDLFNILLQYYRKDKICVPSTYYKNKPTNKIYMMFRRLVKKAVRKYVKDILEFLDVLLTECSTVWKPASPKTKPLSPKSLSNPSQTKVRKGEKVQRKTTNVKKSKDKPKVIAEDSKDMFTFLTAILEGNFVVKTLKQIINDYIKYMSLLKISPSNLTLSGKVQAQGDEETNYIECGDLMFIYGSPKSDAGKFTWRISHFWEITVVSLDWEILNDLIENYIDENKFIRDVILDYFFKRFDDEEKDKYDFNTLEGWEGIINLVSNQYFLEYKIQKEVTESKSKVISTRKRTDSLREPVTLLNIPWKYFEEIIARRLYLRAKNGLVFESIQSKFFLDPVSTLIVLLDVFQASKIYLICLCDNADRLDSGPDDSTPDPNVLQAFSNLHYLNYFSLPTSVREKMAVELKKLLKKNAVEENEDDISDVTETKKEVRRKGNRNFKGKRGLQESEKSSKKGTPFTVNKKIEVTDKKKKLSKIKSKLSEHLLPEAPVINEYLENLKKIQGFVESHPTFEVSRRSLLSRISLKLDVNSEIMKKKARLSASKEYPFDFWIFCSHQPYKDYQFENYLPLVESWKNISEKPERRSIISPLQPENRNYFVIKKKVEKIYPKSDWENPCKLFEVINAHENINLSEPVIAYTNVSRSKIQMQSKFEVKNKDIEAKKSSNIEMIENLLKDVEATYQKEMDHRLKILNSKFESGVKIKPGGFIHYDILFHPTGCSTYIQDIDIRISGCDEVKKISVSASCDIPDILFDPCHLFSNITMTECFGDVLTSSYILKSKTFHFGTALIGHEDDERLFQVKSFLKLKNTSAIPVKLTVSIIEENFETGNVTEEDLNDKNDLELVKEFLKKNKIMEQQHRVMVALNSIKSDVKTPIEIMNNNILELYSSPVFSLETPNIEIDAGEEKKFTISACPSLEGLYSCRYLFSIENNPKVYSLKALCSGTLPNVVFNPTELLFEDVIIYRQISRQFSLTNKCALPLNWEIVNAESIHPKVSLSRTHGTLKPDSLEVVYLTFHPTEILEIREQLVIQIFDEKVKGNYLLEHKYAINLRSYDVFTEVCFEKSSGNSINLNNVIVFEKIIEEFGIKNRGRNDILVKMALNKGSRYLKNQVKVDLKDGYALITPQVFFPSELSIICLEELKLEEEPLIILEILDYSSFETVAKIPLYVSLQSYFSRFTISPTHNLNFGNLMVGELKCLEISLINCGKIDFKFRFIPEKQSLSEEKRFLTGLNPKIGRNTGNKLKKKLRATINQSRNLEYDDIFKKNFSNLLFMNKFLKMKNAELRNADKPRNYLKCLFKNMGRRQWKLKFHLTKSKVRNSKDNLNYYDLAHIKTIKNLWSLFNFDVLKTIATTRKKVNCRKSDVNQLNEESQQMLWQTRKLKCYVPPFRLVPATGKLAAGQESIIRVHCNPLYRSNYLETVNLFVTDSHPEVRRGFPIYLSVESCVPKVNFEDYNLIFREIVVVDKCNEHVSDDGEGAPYGVFCIQENSLLFFNTIVGTSHTVTAFLHSENQLEAAVLVALSNRHSTSISPFSVNEKDSCVVYINPYGYSSFTITYSPQHLEECKATITMTLEVPVIAKDEGWFSSITVVGKGNYPSIMMKLVGSIEEECEIIDYGIVLISSSEKKLLCLENKGKVTAQVVLEVLNNKNIFSIGVTEQLEEHIEICDADTFMNTKVSIPPQKKCEVILEFKPKELLTYSSRINVHILYNPFETLFINVYGTGYIEDLVIAGLKFTHGEPLTLGGPITAEYFLDFGYCIAGKKYSKEFTLISYCDNIIRFRFDNYERITFIPNIGHIFPGSNKKILSIVQISDCMELDEGIQCFYQEIMYKQNTESEQWDNIQKSIKWTKVEGDSLSQKNFHQAHILKIERYNEEPEYNIITAELLLRLTLSAVIDTPKLNVITEMVEFSHVMVSQSSKEKVVIQSTKNCEVSFSMTISDEISETPESVPEVTDFSFGKFDYDLLELKSKEYSMEQTFSHSNQNTTQQKELWNELRKKHLQSLYGKSVNIILPKDTVEMESGKEDIKSLKKTLRLKSKYRTISEVKKRGIFKKIMSATSISSKRDSKSSEGKRGSGSSAVLKYLHKLGNKKSDEYEFNFSDLIKIGKTHIILSADLPKSPVPGQVASWCQCFSVDVASGTLKPNETLTCTVTFSPKHIKCYKADLRIYNVETGEFHSLFLHGVGILPLCHIEIYEDDYLTVNNPIILHLPSNTRAVTVESIFKESTLRKSFKVYNIAEIPYHFEWIHIRSSGSSSEGVKCLTLEGEIPPRDSYEMEFSLFPLDYNVYESLWLLKIKEFFLEQYILIVFKVRKPLVSFERKFMVCEPSVKGCKRMLKVKLINNEDVPFNYAVNEDSLYSGPRNDKWLSISPMLGIIGPNTEELLEIEFTAKCTSDLTFYIRVSIHSDNDHLKYEIPPLRILSKCYSVEPKLSCLKEDGSKHELFPSDIKSDNIITIGKICKGPDFFIKLTGTAAEPVYDICPKSINFGICLIDEKNNSKHHRVLEFSNLDTESVLLEKLDAVEGFIVNFSSLIIEPRAVHKILIIFNPLSIKKYSGKIQFLVNGVFKHNIEVSGEGEALKLALHEKESILTDFGLLKAREICCKEVAIVNKSRVPVDFSLNISQEKKNDLFQLTIDVFEKKLHLLPDEVRVVKVSIYAETRIQTFTCNIIYEGCGVEEVLFIVKGTVIDYKFELDQKSILFESAGLGCVTTKQVALINSGDIGSRFKLQTRFVSDVFAMKPMDGYSPPGSRTIIEISFMPNFVIKYFNNVLLFLIENYEPLTLMISGVGANFPPPTEIIRLRTHVRTAITHYVDLTNRSYEEMTVYPMTSGEYFSTEEFMVLAPNSHNDCKVTYYPQTMTTTQHHMGHFFCGFPNGELVFCQFVGEAIAPTPGELDWECKARKQFSGKIPLNNWGNSSENFRVEIKSIKLTVAAFYKITSQDIISIPPKETRNCIINLLSYKRTEMNFNVFFTNISSKEYLHYKVHVKFTPPEAQTFKLTTTVHEPTYYKLCLSNPMDKITSFKFKSPHPDLEPSLKIVHVRPLRKKYLALKYIPTRCGTSNISFKISNYLLGETVYKAELSALNTGAERFIEVQVPIGISKSFSIPVKNPFQKVVTFIFESDSRDLSTKETSFFVGPGKKIMLDVMYEPSSLGNHLMNITLHTNGYGDFLYCVKGLCTHPEPSGPLIIPKEEPYELEFKNIFYFPQEYFLKVNNEHFKIKPEKLFLHPKESGLVFISLKQVSETEESGLVEGIPQAGKLTVLCLAPSLSSEWVYFLKAAS
nr:hydrocephalus-inducing protein isoform X1 [Halyomorpha halys]